MGRAARLGMMIGLVIGLSACASSGGRSSQGHEAGTGFYGGVELGRTG